MPKVDKLIVTNFAALRAKYGSSGLTAIRSGVKRLKKADKDRGLTTRLLDLSGAGEMKSVGRHRVSRPKDPRQNKAAIDAAYRAMVPDYLLILGSTDVVPHQPLVNPLYTSDPDGDNDHLAYSDLPYACEAAYSRRIEDFRGPTRVVGRLPDLTGARDPRYLLGLLSTAAGYRTRTRDQYGGYFGLSVKWWRSSTALSLRMIAGSDADLKLSPNQGPLWTRAELRPRVHFINCHGATVDPGFYGQATSESEDYPEAHLSKHVDGRVTRGTVVAAECCYGAELYDPSDAQGRRGICYAYLANGAYGFLGSTTIAYGPSSGNGWADLLCRYFLEEVLRGASLGRALLEARLQYVLGASVMQGEDLKTLAQFHLLGDPSVHPISRVTQGLEKTPLFRRALVSAGQLPPGRGLRRDRLMRTGMLCHDTVGSTRHAPRLRAPAIVKQVLAASARDGKVPTRRMNFRSYSVHDPAGRRLYREAGLHRRTPDAVYTVSGAARRGRSGLKRVVLVSATVVGGRVVRLRRLHSR